MSMVERSLGMIHTLGNETNASFLQSEVITRALAFPLAFKEAAEFASTFFQLPAEAMGSGIMKVVRKIHPDETRVNTWDEEWQPLKLAKKIGCLILGLLSTLLLGWSLPRMNLKVHDYLGLWEAPKEETIKSASSVGQSSAGASTTTAVSPPSTGALLSPTTIAAPAAAASTGPSAANTAAQPAGRVAAIAANFGGSKAPTVSATEAPAPTSAQPAAAVVAAPAT